MKRSLRVWWDGRVVGTLRTNEHGEMQFVYESTWLADAAAAPLSLSLPKREAPFKRRECRPFLLPEDVQRDGVARALGVSRGNDFALLDALGGDVAGALTLLPEGVPPPHSDSDIATRPLEDEALRDILDRLPSRPLLAGQDGLRLSLAGAQSKLPVVLVDGRVALPVPGQPTTHILKPPTARFSGTTENEALVMRLAARCALPVAHVEPRVVERRPYLLIERYDRRVTEGGRVRRLHQEDFCQAPASGECRHARTVLRPVVHRGVPRALAAIRDEGRRRLHARRDRRLDLGHVRERHRDGCAVCAWARR